ncbi:potassium/sodium hyperpolarization-activated cyclic nucleotide-gated channel 1-like [Odontomachus brunneus]|uniref:potassium/sodium hyperpolarization-activated cyclic nucleotide-gated channel 1-like n=1 Tax=Odontomachus brunneus TaxID=486640 RepID=UPI0013F20AB0|nr:potassium/sodium hyperpolarization-activated cyclic nucleotide-gated channel 1-like [Odontomachus brunneus]XP_032682376.1 potassium/sodium hyperpolarization-activated cyclic nucleotide-gated channel 1-like [Odontomachus brunneus]
MTKHICELPVNREHEFPFATIQPLTFKNVWIAWCGISKYTPKCGRYMDSTATVTAERRRHAALKHWWIIHPFSYAKYLSTFPFIYDISFFLFLSLRYKILLCIKIVILNEKIHRYLWDTFMMAIYSIAFLTIPFMICFVVMDYESILLDKVNIPIYAICWLDISLNCITGYYDSKDMHIELKLSKILMFYLKGLFLPDVLSSFPYDHITLPWRRLPGDGSYHIVTLINILPFMKITRYSTFRSNIFYLFQHFEIKHFYYELYITLLLGIYLIFWFSCLCYLIPILLMMHFVNIPPRECENCWMTGLEDRTLMFRFQNAMLIVLENVLATGYGLFKPKTDGHLILSSFIMLIGRIILCYFLSKASYYLFIVCLSKSAIYLRQIKADALCLLLVMFLRVTSERTESETKFQEIINEVKAYTRQKQLVPHMKKRLLAYYYYRFKNSYFREKQILSNLSETLREEIALESCRRLIENVAIFKSLPRHILQSIVKNLKFELYLPNEVIIKAGSHGDCMFFLSSGTVAILTPTGKEICHLDDGAYFGEIALLVADERRVASVVAIDVCELYRIDRKDFRQCIAVHSELFAEIERIAIERVDKIVRAEKQYKHFLMRPPSRAKTLLPTNSI